MSHHIYKTFYVAFLFFVSTLFFQSSLVAQQDLEKQIAAEIRRIKGQLKKDISPRAREMLEGVLGTFERKEYIVTKRLSKSDRWDLVDIQFHSDKKQSMASQTGFGFRYRGGSQGTGQSGYQVKVVTPPPKHLYPGQVFKFVTQVSSTKSKAGFRRHPRLKYYFAAGDKLRLQRRLSNFPTLKKGKSFSEIKSFDNRFFLKTENKQVSNTNDSQKSIVTSQIRMGTLGIPMYLRIGLTTQNGENTHRLVYVYKWVGPKAVQNKAEVAILDANPIFNHNKLPKDLKSLELIKAGTVREGTTADGISQLILRLELPSKDPVSFSLDESQSGKLGTLQPLMEGRTLFYQNKHYAFALYTPPKKYGGGPSSKKPTALFHPDAQPVTRLEDILEYRLIKINYQTPAVGKQSLSLKLARPPVVLVHGFMSDPYTCWVATKDNGTSMVVLLEKAGFLPFLVNYNQTNGVPFLSADGSSFRDNAKAVWDRDDKYEFPPIYEGWVEKKEIPASKFQLWKGNRIGGIKHALEHYREKLNIAATQADVIGHSMGGLLARVYASKHYHPEYRRSENFFQGDIHRLITLNTPHFGSELPHLYDALLKGKIDGESWWQFAKRVPPKAVGWAAGGLSPAAKDLSAPISKTEVNALTKIGPTEIPSFAITTEADHKAFLSKEYDKYQRFRSAFGTIGMVFFYNRPLLTDFVRTRANQWNEAPEGIGIPNCSTGIDSPYPYSEKHLVEDYLATLNENIESDVYFWMLRRDRQSLNQQVQRLQQLKIYSPDSVDTDRDSLSKNLFDGLSTIAIGGKISVLTDPSKEPDVPPVVIAQIRDLIFHNDHENDGAVRVVSQKGGLKNPHTKNFKNVLHSFSPWNYLIQRQVIELLKWDDHLFDQDGFGDAGKLMPRYLPNKVLAKGRETGELAVSWSGLVPSHAKVYAEVADKMDAVILVRPVNRDSTKLIAENNATKAMAVKGKSANWGPQTGFIPVKQRYSKIWKVYKDNPAVRKQKITEFDKITQEMLGLTHPDYPDRTYAISRPLKKKVNGVLYEVLLDVNSKQNDAEKEIYLHHDGKYLNVHLQDVTAKVDKKLAKTLKDNPMNVLADGVMDGAKEKDPPLYLTADYDLLAIGMYEKNGFPYGKPKEVDQVPFDNLMGYVLPRQKTIINALNKAVEERAGYKGGNVTHHGPEVQYAKSPYVDYPILVCDPGEPEVYGDSQLFIIRQGPPGFRDIHLKRYFTQQIQKKFRLWPNPDSDGWLWRNFDPIAGYDSRDDPKLLPYVDEQPRPEGDLAKENQLQNDSTEKSFAQVFELANQGDPVAQIELAKKYYEGKEVKKDLALCREWTKRAYLSGTSDSKVAYAQVLLDGIGGPVDSKQAIDLLNQAIEESQNPGAYAELAYAYELGIGVRKDMKKALELYKKASQRGDAESSFVVGDWLVAGIAGKPDPKKAIPYLQQAAEKNLSHAHYILGSVHYYGDRGKRDLRLAAKHFQKEIDISGSPGAKTGLGMVYMEGSPEIQKNPKKAFQLFSQAAEQNTHDAMYQLSWCYQNGLGTKKDLVSAYAWLSATLDSADTRKNNPQWVQDLKDLDTRLTDSQRQNAKDLLKKIRKRISSVTGKAPTPDSK